MAHTAKDLMKPVVTVPPDTTIAKAARLMKQHSIGSLMVGERGKEPTAIVTERDLVRRVLAEGLEPEETLVSAVMTKGLFAVEAAAPWEQILDVFCRDRFRHMPVSEGGRIVGILSITDVADILAVMVRSRRAGPPKKS